MKFDIKLKEYQTGMPITPIAVLLLTITIMQVKSRAFFSQVARPFRKGSGDKQSGGMHSPMQAASSFMW